MTDKNTHQKTPTEPTKVAFLSVGPQDLPPRGIPVIVPWKAGEPLSFTVADPLEAFGVPEGEWPYAIMAAAGKMAVDGLEYVILSEAGVDDPSVVMILTFLRSYFKVKPVVYSKGMPAHTYAITGNAQFLSDLVLQTTFREKLAKVKASGSEG